MSKVINEKGINCLAKNTEQTTELFHNKEGEGQTTM